MVVTEKHRENKDNGSIMQVKCIMHSTKEVFFSTPKVSKKLPSVSKGTHFFGIGFNPISFLKNGLFLFPFLST